MSKRAYIFLPFLFCACKKEAPALFELLDAARTGINFANKLSESDSLNILNYVYYFNGGGTGVADFNNDGLPDIFFAGNESSCRLYLNKGNLTFEDVTEQAGVQTTQWCTGVAAADVNADGWMDIYVCAAGYADPARRKNLLFINNGSQGKLGFTESAASYGLADTSYSTQAAFFDYDLDNDLDLYVMNHANERETLNTPLPKKTKGEGSSTDHLYRNNGDQTFTDVSKEAGILIEGFGLGLAITDINADGWPDVYVANDFIYNDLLYINEGGKRFSNQISQYLNHTSYNSMGCDFADYNNDVQPDLVVMDMLPETDAKQKMMAGAMTWDKWQIIQQAGYEPQYVRNTLQLGRPTAYGGRLTVDGQRLEGDDDLILSRSTKPTPIYRRPSAVGRPPSTVSRQPYAEIAQLAGIAATDWSWAPLFADFDNDGWKDLFITNGYLRDITDRDFISYSNNLSMFKDRAAADREILPKVRQLKGRKLPNRIFQNNRDLTFSPKHEDWGITQPSFSNGAAYADLDNDGDLDLVVNNINETAFVYENKADKLLVNNYLNVKLEGTGSNKAGIGAQVLISAGGQQQYLEQYPSRGFMSTVTDVLHFGLGSKVATVDTLWIRWNDGAQQCLTGVATNQTLPLKQSDARPLASNPAPPVTALMQELNEPAGLDFKHNASVYNDFQTQPLLPHGFSENGPPIAVGDLNGDGLDDCFAGAGNGQAGQLFFQKTDGSFSQQELPESVGASTAALIFDANGDHLNDLLVLSGGPESTQASNGRLFVNRGKGDLQYVNIALPAIPESASCATAADFDADGDLDLFIGGSVETSRYPMPARSYLLRNDGGQFTDVTTTLAPALERPGIVNAAAWADLDQNGSPDLVLAGEWMPITVFKNTSGKFSDATAEMGLDKTSGWWNSLVVSDLDGDGALDLVAGNLGLNTKYKVAQDRPLTVYANDFDHNGSLDAVLTQFREGKEKPVHQRDELQAQLNGIGRKYPRYALYATATVQEIFGEKVLAEAYTRKCYTLQSSSFTQKNGKFMQRSLPTEAQFAPVNAMLCTDVNSDGLMDLILAGNAYSAHISSGRYDASAGLVLLGDGKGQFNPVPADRSGFSGNGVSKSLAVLRLNNGKKYVLLGVNGAALKMFQFNTPINTQHTQ